MSRRFGRNQRRRAREAIAVAKSEAALNLHEARRWYGAYAMADNLAKYLGQRLREVREELADAKAIAGELSILFPATEYDMDGDRRRDIERGASFVVAPPNLRRPPDIARSYLDEAMTRVALPVLLTGIREDVLQNRVHVRVRFNDGSGDTGYAIDPRHFHQYPRATMQRRIVEAIAPDIARHLLSQFYQKG